MNPETEKKPQRTKKVLTIAGIIIGSLLAMLLAIFAGLLIYVDANDESIKEVIIDQLNSHLDADITITAADIEVMRHFPDISVKLSGTTISPPGYSPDLPPLAQAGSFFIRIDLLSVLRKEYNIEAFVLEDAEVVIFRNKKGKTNYDFLSGNGSQDSTSSGIPVISVPALQLKNVGIRYIDDEQEINITGDIQESKLNLKVRDSIVAVNLDITAKASVPGISLPGDYTSLLFEAEYKPHEEEILISGGRIKLDEMVLYLSSESVSLVRGEGYNLRVEARDLDIQKALALMPDNTQEVAVRYNPHGKISFIGNIIGGDLYSGIPKITVDASLSMDTLYPMGRDLVLHNLTAEIEAGYDPERPSDFFVKAMNMNLHGQKNSSISGWFVMRNLEQQFVNSSLKGNIDLNDLGFLLPKENSASGTAVVDLQYKGTLSGFKTNLISELKSSESNLEIDMQDCHLQLSGQKDHISISSFKGTITPKLADIKNLTVKINESDATLSGNITGILDLLAKKKSPFSGELKIQSRNLNMDSILAVFKTDTVTEHDDKKSMFTLPAMNTKADIIIDRLLYNDIEINDFRLQAKSTSEDLTIESLRLWSCGGNLTATGDLYGYTSDRPRMKSNISLKGIEISDVFSMFHNFGSTSFTNKNINGALTTDIYIASTFKEGFKFDLPTLTSDANIIVTDGALKDFAPLTEFSGFLGLDDLSNIQFETLENQIFIKDETINIPGMEIKNNVLDLYMDGRQTFSGDMDYHIDLALAELLSGKYEEKNSDQEFGVVMDDDRKGSRLYVKVTGTTEEPKFKYDTPKARKEISKELQKEKEELINLIKGEEDVDSIQIPEESSHFNVQWGDSVPTNRDSVKVEKKEKEKSGKKFEIDW